VPVVAVVALVSLVLLAERLLGELAVMDWQAQLQVRL
jgi:hypothetical protein